MTAGNTPTPGAGKNVALGSCTFNDRVNDQALPSHAETGSSKEYKEDVESAWL